MSLKNLADSLSPNRGDMTRPRWGERNKELRHHPDAKKFAIRTPICKTNIGHYDVKDIIMRQGDEQMRKTNVKAQMTQWFMHTQDMTFAKIADLAVKFAVENSPYSVGLEPFDCWGSISRKGDYTKTHDHWPHPWSWVYYSDVSESCSPLMFPDIANAPQGAHYVYPKSGDLVLFPGWLYHGVEKQSTDYERVIVAGNLKLTK